MTPSLSASVRHRLRRLAAAPAMLAALLTLALAGPAAAAPSASSPATATTAPAPAATGDASTVTFAVAPSADGVVTAGQPLAVSVSARNATGSTVPASSVHLTTSTQALATRADVKAWLAAPAADAARTELAVADGEVPSIVPLGVGSATLSLDATALAALAPGVYPLRADYGSGASTTTAVSVFVVPGDAGTGALGLVAPLTAPAQSTGLLTSTELAELTAPDGELRAQLDAVSGTAAILAVDPAIVAAIRVLGTSAPASATRWLADLLQLPNSRFALQFGDADLAAQVAAGQSTPLTVSTLAPYLTESDFTGITPTPAPSGSADPTADPTPGPTGDPAPTPTPTGNTGTGPTLPTLAQLTDIGAGTGSVFWPASGTATADVVAALGALTVDDIASITLVDSETVTGSETQAAAGARGTANGAQVLVYDADASRALATAAATDMPLTRAEALAEASAYAALAVAANPSAPLLVALDRPSEVTGAGARAAVVAGTHLAGRAATDLATLTAAPAATLSIAGGEVPTDRAADLTALLAGEDELTDFATILADPALLTARERASILQLLGNGWRAQPAQAATALEAHRTQTQETLEAVAVVPPSDITLAATSAPLTFSVRNDLPWPVSLRLIATPNDPRLVVQNTTEVEAGPEQNTRVQVPVEARVGSGESTLSLQLRSPAMVAIGDTVPVHVTVRAEWESVGLIVMATLVGAMIVIGIVRTVRKMRRRKEDSGG
ncbi:DUF6049 family protein [Microbacterium lacticum]